MFRHICFGAALTDYAEIQEDVHEECSKYGQVLELKIPRPQPPKENKGVGKIFVKYDTPDSAQKALRALAGRKFADRTVVVTFFGEVRSSPGSAIPILMGNRSTSTSMLGEAAAYVSWRR